MLTTATRRVLSAGQSLSAGRASTFARSARHGSAHSTETTTRVTHLAIPLVQLDVPRARVRELPADKEAGRRERVRVGERDAPELCGHGEVYGGDEVKNVINVGDDTLFTSRHCMLYTHHTTDNVQQGIYRQDGHGPAGERAAVSMHACMQLRPY